MSKETPTVPKGWLGEINEWQIVDDSRITYGIGELAVIGEVLIGPHEAGGAQAFLPAGVWSNTPEGFGYPVTNMGWRHGVWPAWDSEQVSKLHDIGLPVKGDETNIVWVTRRERPLQLSTIELKQVDERIRKTAPEEFADFVRDATRNRVIRLRAITLPDTPHSDIEKKQARDEVRALQTSAMIAFGENWVSRNLQGKPDSPYTSADRI